MCIQAGNVKFSVVSCDGAEGERTRSRSGTARAPAERPGDRRIQQKYQGNRRGREQHHQRAAPSPSVPARKTVDSAVPSACARPASRSIEEHPRRASAANIPMPRDHHPDEPPTSPATSRPRPSSTRSASAGGAIQEPCCTSSTMPRSGSPTAGTAARRPSRCPARARCSSPVRAAAAFRGRAHGHVGDQQHERHRGRDLDQRSERRAPRWRDSSGRWSRSTGPPRSRASRARRRARRRRVEEHHGVQPDERHRVGGLPGVDPVDRRADEPDRPRLAPTARARKAKIVSGIERNIDVMAATIQTNTGPYTDGVSRHPGQVNRSRGRSRDSSRAWPRTGCRRSCSGYARSTRS